IPSCSPSSPTKRISAAVISPLIRCALSWAMPILQVKQKRTVHPATRQSLARRNLLAESSEQGANGHRPEVLAGAGSYSHLCRLHLFGGDDQLIRQFLQAMFSNLIGYFLVAQIGVDAEPGVSQARLNLLRVERLAVGDRQHCRLYR